jgi:hypothetical protein
VEWISVNDRLPVVILDAPGKSYITMEVICYDGNEVFHGEFSSGMFPEPWHKFSKSYKDDRNVTHWMPLPPPPKE